MAYTPLSYSGGDPLQFWQGVAGNQGYSDQQRQQANQYVQAEQGFAGTDRAGITTRGGIDAFNALYQDPAAGSPAGGGGATPGVDPAQPATTGGAFVNDAPPGNNTTTAGTQNLLNDTLIRLMGQGTDVSIQDPNLAPQAEAYRFARERARNQEQAGLAERLGAQGLESSGAMQSGVQQSYGQMGRDIGGFNASLIGNELNSRRKEIMQALALGGELISGDQRNALARELNALNAALERERMTLQGNLGSQDIGLRRELGLGNLNLGMLSLLFGDQHFNSNLGAQLGMFNAGLDQNAILALLGQ